MSRTSHYHLVYNNDLLITRGSLTAGASLRTSRVSTRDYHVLHPPRLLVHPPLSTFFRLPSNNSLRAEHMLGFNAADLSTSCPCRDKHLLWSGAWFGCSGRTGTRALARLLNFCFPCLGLSELSSSHDNRHWNASRQTLQGSQELSTHLRVSSPLPPPLESALLSEKMILWSQLHSDALPQ